MIETQTNGHYQRCIVGDIFVYADLFPLYSYGSRVIVSGKIKRVEFVNYFCEFVVLVVLRNSEIERIEQKNLLFSLFICFSVTYTSYFFAYLGHDESGFLLGIVFWVHEGFSDELYEFFRRREVLYVIAASVSDVALIGGFFISCGEKDF